MPVSISVFLVEFGLTEFVGLVAVITTLAAAAGYAFYSFRLQKNKVRDDATKVKADAAAEWRGVADAHAAKIEILEDQVATYKLAHATCEGKIRKSEELINDITQFNLRLQARERGYQRTINRLEINAGMKPTDFNDITDAPSFDSRR